MMIMMMIMMMMMMMMMIIIIIYSQSDLPPAFVSASVVFLTFSFLDSLLFSCLLSDPDLQLHPSSTAVHKLGSCIQGDGVLFFHSIGNYSWSFSLLSCVLVVEVSCSVSLRILHLL